jgi:hypothetical protein
MDETLAKDKELMRRFQKSPTYFVRRMWGLVPQPVKPECFDEVKALVASGNLKGIKKSHFSPFEKGKHITWQQWLLLVAVELAIRGKGKRRISVRSGHGVGKSCTMSWIILWALFCHKDAQVPCTAPTSSQMHDVLWKELASWLRKMPAQIASLYDWSSEYIRMRESPETWFARARTASKENSEALAGVHGPFVLMAVDEASGVYEEIYNTAEGAMTGENVLVILISNGTRLVGYFYDTHNSDSARWQTLHFNGEDSPIVDQDFVTGIIAKHGRDSDEFRIRVAGEFAAEEGVDDQGYVPLLVEADLRAAKDTALRGRIRLGIDPAKDGGDDMCQAARDSLKAKILELEKVNTPKSIAHRAVGHIKTFGIDPDDVACDNFGEGANVAQEVALSSVGTGPDGKALPNLRINGVNVGEGPDDPERFYNRRAELFWRLREWVKAGGEFCDLDKWREELLSIRYRRTPGAKDRIQIMPKPIMRKLGLNHGRSPNKADALALTFYRPDVAIQQYVQEPYIPTSSYETY